MKISARQAEAKYNLPTSTFLSWRNRGTIAFEYATIGTTLEAVVDEGDLLQLINNPPKRGRPKGGVNARERKVGAYLYEFSIGDQRGCLDVVGVSPTHNEYLCRCQCGNERMYKGSWLANNSHRSCGDSCRGVPTYGPIFKPPMRPDQVVVACRASAKQRNLDSSLTIANVLAVGTICYYCESQIRDGIGLDRIDNARGYHADNVIACCKWCNDARGNMLSVDEFDAAMKVRIRTAKEAGRGPWEGYVWRRQERLDHET